MESNTKIARNEIRAIKNGFRSKDYDFVNKKLFDVVCGSTNLVQSVAILTAAFPSKQKLSNYNLALDATRTMLAREDLDGDKILKGL